MHRLEDVLNTDLRISIMKEMIYHVQIYESYYEYFKNKHPDLDQDDFHLVLSKIKASKPNSLEESFFKTSTTEIMKCVSKLEKDGVPLILISEITNRFLHRNKMDKYVERVYSET